MWQHFVQRYDIRELTDIYQNFAKDAEFKAVLTLGMKLIDDEIIKIEDLTNSEIFRDEHMYRTIYTGIQHFVLQQVQSILQMSNPDIREVFIKFAHNELELYVKMDEYGKLKGWQFIRPTYNPK